MKAPKELFASKLFFYKGFGKLAREVLYVATPGSGSMDVAKLPHTKVTAPLWPRDPDPHETAKRAAKKAKVA